METAAFVQERRPATSDRIHGLRDGEVHVWFASLALPARLREELRASLSSGELARAARLRNPDERDHFTATHGIARTILGTYSGMAPRDLRFEQDRLGKPFLDHPDLASALGFNMSHSRTTALYGVSLGRSIGVDVEFLDPRLINEGVMRQILAPGERAMLNGLPPTEQMETLFRLWTLKEAYLKARGDGLSLPPDMIDVSTALGNAPHTLTGIEELRDVVPCTMAPLPAPPGYAAAVVFMGGPCRIVCRWFQGFLE
jgi:4'-phosphopantetheinyl transferase